MSLRDRARQEAEEGGFRPHPLGTFPGSEIIEVKDKPVTVDGEETTVYEIKVKSPKGTGRMTIWKTTIADIDGKLMSHPDVSTREDAEKKYVEALGRVVRLYRDLGLQEPDAESDEDFENAVYDGMGAFVGQPCTLVVLEGKNEQNPRVFINADRPQVPDRSPPRSAATKAPAQKPATQKTATKGKPQQQAAETQGLDEIPF